MPVTDLGVVARRTSITTSFMSMFTDVTRMSAGDSDDITEKYNTEETRATRLKPDTEREYLRYRDERDISDAEALRRLTRAALDDTDETLQTVNRTALFAGFVYVVVYLTSDPATAGNVGGMYIAFAVIWSTYPATVGEYLP